MAGDNLMASGFQHHFRWNGLTRDFPEILAGYSIQTNKNAKEELEARPGFFWVNVSMVAGISGSIWFFDVFCVIRRTLDL